MNGSLNDPMDGGGSGYEAVASTLRQTSFLRVMVALAATVVVLVSIRLGAPILNPIFFALVLSLLFSLIYSWLKGRGLPSPVILVIMLSTRDQRSRRKRTLARDVMGRGLNISPTIVFLSFIFWAWLLGGPGAFLALPITLFVVVMFDTFPETRWLASLRGVSPPDPDVPVPEEEEVVVERTGQAQNVSLE